MSEKMYVYLQNHGAVHVQYHDHRMLLRSCMTVSALLTAPSM